MTHKATLAVLRERIDARQAEAARVVRFARYQHHRVKYLPKQIAAVRLKLVHLEREAERLGVEL